MKTTAAVWVFLACFGQVCTGPETKIIPGITEAQCLAMKKKFMSINTLKGGAIRDFRDADCIGPDGKSWPTSDAQTSPAGLKAMNS